MPDLPQVDQQFVRYVVAAIVVVGALWVVWRGEHGLTAHFGRPRSAPTPHAAEKSLDQLAPSGPPEMGPSLAIYHVPVRLAVLVVAPVGRGSALPSRERLPHIIDQIVPGLAAVVTAHGTRVILWPPQLSTQGFARALFTDMPLPGNRGKGTPWCAAAGRFTADGQAFLAGTILRAASANNLSQTTLERETQWLEMLLDTLRTNVDERILAARFFRV